MANYSFTRDLFTSLSTEVLYIILSVLPAKSLLNVSECNRRMRDLCQNCDSLWKRLCKEDFDADLAVKGSFPSYFVLYELLYKSRIILEDTNYCTYTGYLPDWLYYWSALSTKPPLPSFFSLPAGRTKKTWGLTDEDLANYQVKCNRSSIVHLERYYTWADGLEAALCKHNSKERFHEVALKRCMRSKKQIQKNFNKAACSQRKRAFHKFQNENRTSKTILSRSNDGSKYLCYQKPHKIGEDYIEGYLHKSGIKQLASYIEFAQRLEKEVKIEDLSKDIPECVLHVYETLSTTAYQRFISAEEFLVVGQEYFERVKRVWRWQDENGAEARKAYRDCSVVKVHLSYKDFVRHGSESSFQTLQLHFEGLEALGTWLEANHWITKLLDFNFISILRGGNAPSHGAKSADCQLLRKMVRRFLSSGRGADMNKILKHLAQSARQFLEMHMENVEKLESTLSNAS